jgi:hypothetical protein
MHNVQALFKSHNIRVIPGDQEGLFKLAVQLRKFFNSVIYNTATGLCFVGLFDKYLM